MAQYQYEINVCNPESLIAEINTAGLPSIININTVGNQAFINFSGLLTTEQQDTLDSVITDHELLTIKNTRHIEVNNLRSLKLISGYTDGSARKWATTPTDISNLSGVCTLIALGVVTADQTWRDFNNTNHIMTPAQLVQLAAELAIFVRTCYEVSWYHKGQIDLLTTVQDVSAYDITIGWPS